MASRITVADITHPYYDEKFRDWQKWRYTYEGGQRFIDNYLYRYSRRESKSSFDLRRLMTYNPAFAKAAIDEIKNSIFQRLGDIKREGGSKTYQSAVLGEGGGVDMVGSSMASFIGRKILPEMLTMSRVGVYVDMPEISGLSIADSVGKRPYVYVYRAEDIRSWSLDETNNENEFTNILLRDYVYTYNDENGLPSGLISRYRRLWIEDGTVKVKFFNEVGTETDFYGVETTDSIIELGIPRIPFIIVQLSDSLLADVANYQITLMNIASSDVAYTLTANFPFYTEQFEPKADAMFMRKPGISDSGTGGEAGDAASAKTEEVQVGVATGRRYPKGLERPEFIHPSSEPLKASMDKQMQLKAEIRQLVHLAVTNLEPQMASAESKGMDNQGLEAGLSYIGLELENMERKLAGYWSMYEKVKSPSIYYPETYDIKTDAERRAEIEHLMKILDSVPSVSYAKQIAKQIAKLALGRKIKSEDLAKVYKEIDDAPGITAVSDIITQDVAAGLVDLKTASQLRGYPKGSVDMASDDHADRLARIAESQSKNNGIVNGGAARGVSEQDDNPAAGGKEEKKESLDTTQDDVVKNKQRGKGK